MNEEIFRIFIRSIYKIDILNEECDEIGNMFNEYLKDKCTEEQIKNFMPKDLFEIIEFSEHPLKRNGFHPALLLHFDQFVSENMEKNDE